MEKLCNFVASNKLLIADSSIVVPNLHSPKINQIRTNDDQCKDRFLKCWITSRHRRDLTNENK